MQHRPNINDMADLKDFERDDRENALKIRFCNVMFALQAHSKDCASCLEYLYYGDGDLCAKGKRVILAEFGPV